MLQEVRDILGDYASIPPQEIQMESSLQKDLGLNSLDVINIVVEFEDAFDIEIDEPDIRAFATVGDLVTYLENHPMGAPAFA